MNGPIEFSVTMVGVGLMQKFHALYTIRLHWNFIRT